MCRRPFIRARLTCLRLLERDREPFRNVLRDRRQEDRARPNATRSLRFLFTVYRYDLHRRGRARAYTAHVRRTPATTNFTACRAHNATESSSCEMRFYCRFFFFFFISSPSPPTTAAVVGRVRHAPQFFENICPRGRHDWVNRTRARGSLSKSV